MGVAAKSKRQPLLEDRIDSFCHSATELLINIHQRCDSVEVKKAKKKSKKGINKIKKDIARDEDIDMEME